MQVLIHYISIFLFVHLCNKILVQVQVLVWDKSAHWFKMLVKMIDNFVLHFINANVCENSNLLQSAPF